MAKQPEDSRTADMFASAREDGVAREAFARESQRRIKRFQDSRKLFPAASRGVCEACGAKHRLDRDCQS